MLVLHAATIMIYLTSYLTSGFQELQNPKSNTDVPQALRELFDNSSSNTEIPAASLTDTRSVRSDENANISKSISQLRTVAEDDLKINSNDTQLNTPSSKRTEVVAEGVSLPTEDLTPASDVKSKAIPRPSGIMARKGAPLYFTSEEQTSRSKSETKDDKLPIAVSSGTNETSTKSPSSLTEATPSAMKKAQLEKKVNHTEQSIKVEIPSNKTVPTVLLVPSQAHPSVARHTPKPKPRVTIGEGDDEQRMPPLPTEKPLLGMPRKMDYIVPIVITVMAVPLLAIGAFVLYKRSRDCWDRRHYRRMDFLIDGMYND